MIADEHNRQVHQPGRTHSHEQSGSEQQLEVRRKSRENARKTEDGKARCQHRAAAETIGEYANNRGEGDAGKRCGSNERTGAGIGSIEGVKDVRDQRCHETVAHDSGECGHKDEGKDPLGGAGRHKVEP